MISIIKQTILLSPSNMDMDEMDYFSIKRRRGSIDEDEERELEEYFASAAYVPLSNLPTPPVSKSYPLMMSSQRSTSGSNLSGTCC